MSGHAPYNANPSPRPGPPRLIGPHDRARRWQRRRLGQDRAEERPEHQKIAIRMSVQAIVPPMHARTRPPPRPASPPCSCSISRPTASGNPVPMLDGKSPLQAVRSAKGRIAAANWLEGFEQNSARRPPRDPMRNYDFGWMWDELGISDLRT